MLEVSFWGHILDYFTLENKPMYVDGPICMIGYSSVQRWLNEVNNDKIVVHGIVRGHQHSDELFGNLLEVGEGYAAIMDNKIHTIFSGAAADQTFLPYDSFLLINTCLLYTSPSPRD